MGREIMSLPAPPADRRVPYGEHPSQFIDWRFPAEPGVRPIVVIIHGGFWRAQRDLLYAGHLCAALTAAGFVTANIEYRRVGEEGGGWPGTFHDVTAAFNAARVQAGADGPGAIVVGHSAGGHLALLLASGQPGLTGAVALAPAACLLDAWEKGLGDGAVTEFLLGSPDELPHIYELACPSRRQSSVPRVLIHGTADDIVPIGQSREYVRLRSHDPGPVLLLELPGTDHFDIIDPRSAVFARVVSTVCDLAAGTIR
ncbi:MAG TPA: alpha/beta hydrolase [Bryobacteraceae bacterium]